MSQDPEDNKHNYPQAVVQLVDALRAYIRIAEETRDDLLSLNPSTDIEPTHLARCRALLVEVERLDTNDLLFRPDSGTPLIEP